MPITVVDKSTATLLESMGRDESIVEAAVVSSGREASSFSAQRTEGLITRLMRDRHGSPFEQVVFKFLIDAPMFTMRQLMRHRVASYNEVSGRYRILEPRFYLPPMHRPMRSVEGSKVMDYDLMEDRALANDVDEILYDHADRSWDRYERLIEMGVTREVARMVLPPYIMTQAVATFNLRSLFNLMSLRGLEQGTFPSHPQFEIAQLTSEVESHVMAVCPIAHGAFVSGGRVSP